MKKIILALMIALAFSANAQTSFQWAKKIGGTGNDYGNAVATDASGNVYATGYFEGIVDFDPGPMTYTLGEAFHTSCFITKLDGSGNFIWAKRFDGQSSQGFCIKIDAAGSIYVAGSIGDTTDFDPGVGTFTLSSNGNEDVFITKLSSAGNFIWAKTFGGINNDHSSSLIVDLSGNVFIAGYFAQTVDFDPGAGVYNLTTGLASDGYVLKLDPSGNFMWAKTFGSSYVDVSNSVTTDNAGNVYIVGDFTGTVDFDSGPSVFNLSSQGTSDKDLFILKLDNAGNFVWAESVTGGGDQTGKSVAMDALSNLYITGGYNNVTDFDPGSNVVNLNIIGSSYAGFVLKLDASGNFIYVKDLVGASIGTSIAVDLQNDVYVAGAFGGYQMDFNPGLGTYTLSPTGTNSDPFILKLTATGEFHSAVTFGSINYEEVFSIAVDGSGNAYTTGYFQSTLDINPDAAVYNLVSSGYYDGFLLKVNMPCLLQPAPVNTTFPSYLQTCQGSSTYIEASGTGPILWYATPTSTVPLEMDYYMITPTLTAGSTSFYATVNTCGESPRTVVTVTVDPNCQYVFPGDANSDGIADNLDILELGLHFNQTGPQRQLITTNWQACYATNWVGTISSGKNLNHSDCNGDGVINATDTVAIVGQFGTTHVFKQLEQTLTNPQLSVLPDQSAVVKGAWGSSSVYMGDAANPVNSLNGVAFTVNFDNALIESNKFYIVYEPSFLDATQQNLNFRALDFFSGKLYAATTHTNNINVAGYGKIATLHYQINSNLNTDDILNIGILQAYKSDASGTVSPLTSNTSTLMAIGASVGVNEFYGGNLITVSPNPANSSILISSKMDLERVELVNLTGQALISDNANAKTHRLNIENIANGVYFVKVYNSSKQVVLKKLIIQK